MDNDESKKKIYRPDELAYSVEKVRAKRTKYNGGIAGGILIAIAGTLFLIIPALLNVNIAFFLFLIAFSLIFCLWINKPDLPIHFTSDVSVEPVKAIDIAFLEQERIKKEKYLEQERLERIKEQEREQEMKRIELAKEQEQIRIEQERTQAITKKLKEIIEVSTKVGLDRIQNVLEMDRKTFDNSIFRWAKEFGFTIDGDYLVINKETVNDFIESLDKEFSVWSKKEQNKIEKVE